MSWAKRDGKRPKAKQSKEERCIAVELLWNAQYKRETEKEREREKQA